MRKVYDRIIDMRGNLITVAAEGVCLGEVARIHKRNGTSTYASVLRFDEDLVTLQVFESTRGISTGDHVTFLNKQIQAAFSDSLLGRRLSGAGEPIDDGPEIIGEEVDIGKPSFNPTRRVVPHQLVRTNIPMIDVFNCLVKSQKIPIFSVAGEPYNALLMRIANQTDAHVVIIAGMGLRFDDYQAFIDNAEKAGSIEKTVMFIHKATDPAVECLLVPDMALAVAEKFAIEGKDVLVLMTDMTAFADAIKEIAITMDQIPSNRGYPGSLYSDLAARYEKAVDIDGSGTITIISVTTMPGGDVTRPDRGVEKKIFRFSKHHFIEKGDFDSGDILIMFFDVEHICILDDVGCDFFKKQRRKAFYRFTDIEKIFPKTADFNNRQCNLELQHRFFQLQCGKIFLKLGKPRLLSPKLIFRQFYSHEWIPFIVPAAAP